MRLDLPADVKEVWDALSPGLRSTLKRLARRRSDVGDELSLANILRQLDWQKGRCAATGRVLLPRGLSAPQVLVLDRDRGYDIDNFVLVAKAYMLCRAAEGQFGIRGHEAVVAWWTQALPFAQNRDDLREELP